MINTKEMENKIRELLDKKISDGEINTLHEFYKFPNLYKYSVCNQIAIWLQGGSIVAGFHGWKKFGRWVKKGEHASIAILAPSMAVIKSTDKDGQEKKDKILRGFVGVRVFDIKQTDGKPLEYAANTAEAIVYEYNSLVEKLAAALDVKIELGVTGQARGSYWRELKEIRISEFSNNSDRVHTLFHECAHHVLLSDDSSASDDYSANEVEAELTVHLVCGALGLEFKTSEAYIASWNKNKPQVRVIKVLGAVQKIINGLK